jgi:hypothetical protein
MLLHVAHDSVVNWWIAQLCSVVSRLLYGQVLQLQQVAVLAAGELLQYK